MVENSALDRHLEFVANEGVEAFAVFSGEDGEFRGRRPDEFAERAAPARQKMRQKEKSASASTRLTTSSMLYGLSVTPHEVTIVKKRAFRGCATD